MGQVQWSDVILESGNIKWFTDHPMISEMSSRAKELFRRFFGSQWKEGSFVMLRIGVTATSA